MKIKTKSLFVALSALLVLLSLAGMTCAAESVEIRSEVLEYSFGFGDYISPNTWAALYYDVKNNAHTEELYLADCEVEWDDGPFFDKDAPLAPGHVGIVYLTIPAFQKFEYDWSILIDKPFLNLESMEYDTQKVSVPAGFAVIGFFGEPYVALSDDQITGYHADEYSFFVEGYDDYKANKIAPLVANDDSKFTSKAGTTLDLGNEYSLFIEQIDVEGNEVHLILMKDGQQLKKNIVNTQTSKDWILKTTVLGDKDRQVLRVHVDSVFRGTKDDLVTIDGLWFVDYLNAFEVKSDVDYGKWEAAHISSESLAYIAEDVALSSGSVIPLGKDWNIRVQDGFEVPNVNKLNEPQKIDEIKRIDNSPEIKMDLAYRLPELNNRFYLFKEYTEPGKYDIRSSISKSVDTPQYVSSPIDNDFVVISNPYIGQDLSDYDVPPLPSPVERVFFLPDGVYTYRNFAAFYYDIDTDLSTEVLIAIPQSNYGGSQSFLKESPSFMYLTTTAHTDYEYVPGAGLDENDNFIDSWDSGYDIMGYFGEKYVPLNVVDSEGFHRHDRTKLEKFAPLVTDDDTKYTLTAGGSLELGNGYSLHVTQIDIKGNKADLALYKDNVLITSSIITTSSGGGSGNWIYKDTVLNVKDVQLMRVHVKDVFNGGKTNLVEIDAVWLTDFKNTTELTAGDEVGLLEYNGSLPLANIIPSRRSYSNLEMPNSESILVFFLKNNLAMTDEMDVAIANSMSLKAYEINPIPNPIPTPGLHVTNEDTSGFKYYFYVTREIGNLSSDNGGNNNGNDVNGTGNIDGSNGDGNNNGGNSGSNGSGSGTIINPDNEVPKKPLPFGMSALSVYFFFLLLLIILCLLYLRYRSRKKKSGLN
ncbi:hypothetical protein LJC08_02070 [Methanimicrococcus sp. OttesenSCG-928-J09]|nr:hypothetical protein [Methanimicrococcus sp. OttesenSCG-928-J09]